MSFFSGQGKLWAALRTISAGPVLTVGGFTHLGNCSMFDIGGGAILSQYAKGGSETRAAADRVSEPMSLSITMEEFAASNLAFLLYGLNSSIAGTTVSNEVVIAHSLKMTPLENINLSSFTSLTNSAVSITYVNGVDYAVKLKAGSITIPAGSAIADAQSLKANYVFGAHSKISVGTMIPSNYWLRLEGINIANGNEPVVVDVFDVKFWPLEKLPLITKEHVALSITGRVFYDTYQTDDTANGRLMRIRKP